MSLKIQLGAVWDMLISMTYWTPNLTHWFALLPEQNPWIEADWDQQRRVSVNSMLKSALFWWGTFSYC